MFHESRSLTLICVDIGEHVRCSTLVLRYLSLIHVDIRKHFHCSRLVLRRRRIFRPYLGSISYFVCCRLTCTSFNHELEEVAVAFMGVPNDILAVYNIDWP